MLGTKGRSSKLLMPSAATSGGMSFKGTIGRSRTSSSVLSSLSLSRSAAAPSSKSGSVGSVVGLGVSVEGGITCSMFLKKSLVYSWLRHVGGGLLEFCCGYAEVKMK